MTSTHFDVASKILAAAAICASCSLPAAASNVRFPLGAYLGNPNGSSQSNEQQFEASYTSFSRTLGANPTLIVAYVDYTQTIDNWQGNASWQAWSNAQSRDAKTMLPVVGFPMASIAGGAPSPDQQFQAFAHGQYDGAIRGVIDVWVQNGFTQLIMRPGWEMNIGGPTYVGDDSQSQHDWVAAFRHIYQVMHNEANKQHIGLQVVWNPSATNYSNASATGSLYPGDAYTDIIGVDMYSDMWPFTNPSNGYHDWHTGGEDGSLSQFMADPVNRWHYWTWPAATQWSNDGSNGHADSFKTLIDFAFAHKKPFAVPEAGAGNCNAGRDVCDDPTFPHWLAAKLANAAGHGLAISFVNVWNNNGGGNYEFSFGSDNKPQEAGAWGVNFGTQ